MISLLCCRCFVITCPKLKCSRQTKGSMLVSLLIWILCIATVFPTVVFKKFLILYIFALLPALLFILFLVWTFHALAADTLVTTDEKQRIVRIFLLFFFNYFLMILPGVICSLGVFLDNDCFKVIADKLLTLLLLGPFLDLILVCFMRIRCRFDSTAADVAEHRQPGWVMSQILRDRENRIQTVWKMWIKYANKNIYKYCCKGDNWQGVLLDVYKKCVLS